MPTPSIWVSTWKAATPTNASTSRRSACAVTGSRRRSPSKRVGTMSDVILRVSKLSKAFGSIQALRDVSFELRRGAPVRSTAWFDSGHRQYAPPIRTLFIIFLAQRCSELARDAASFRRCALQILIATPRTTSPQTRGQSPLEPLAAIRTKSACHQTLHRAPVSND